MRGKKCDLDFVSDYIYKCVSNNKTSNESILNCAKQELQDIDLKIIEAEKFKINRSKLLDVISVFENPNAIKKEQDILHMFNIKNHNICKFICNSIKDNVVTLDSLSNSDFIFSDIIFCIKELQKHKVINKIGNNLIRGDKFDLYSKFVLCEV